VARVIELTSYAEVVIAAPASDGEIGILPHHAPLLTRLGIGELRLKKGNETKLLAVSGGFLEVQSGSQVSIFAETAEQVQEIDAERARVAAERAKELLEKKRGDSDFDLASAEAALDRAMLRLKVAQFKRRSSQQQHPSVQ
jgi:F-type H+-transporting ATPase subunit epsilon